ncbi:5'-methylthioadenosine phosphorylase [Cryobacterium sp. TMT2-17-1]|uniref:MTAP family purine nucleoside phosphorylase n=1 Tax=unclassified Cryobacterium TaxID=2649013 RepID=UPI00106CAFED|nr:MULTISPECIES: MTAP family purine nucleoside phosphorylase [unclassified Cryobacterium]TFC49446.1 5'-methylthioadenosine phosphorylase [Cryobacterium sp. TMT2-17-1]TFC68468.1 5'-methylthioadenosine phosphorylase [Cryobacterium sp. TMT2-4]
MIETTSTTTSTTSTADVGVAVIGGSGLYRLFDAGTETSVDIITPYGPPSASISIGLRAGRRVAFLARHGGDHSVAPHLINYRANIWALASLGVKAIISSSAVGGVSPAYPPGMLVVTDQFIDRTSGRADTFYDQGTVAHLAAADPFDPELRRLAIGALATLEENFAPTGTCVVIQGPRFSTRAESLWFRAAGAHTVNMTQYPEVVLAAELNMGTVNLSFVTDADAGLAPVPTVQTDTAQIDTPQAEVEADPDTVSASLVFTRLRAAQPRILAAIDGILRALPENFSPRELIAPEQVGVVLDRRPAPAPAAPAGADA